MQRLYRKAGAAGPAPISDPLRGAWLRRRLAPARVCLYARLGSTNVTAQHLLEQGALQAPAVVLAARQTAGRGQRTNRWWSDAGSLCVTFLRPAAGALPIGQIPLRAGLAVAEVAAQYLPGRRVDVKWPNDILVEGRKLAGLLCARLCGTDLIGIGLNVHTDFAPAPDEVRARATSLWRDAGSAPRRDELAAALWLALAQVLTVENWFERYTERHVLHGRRVQLDGEGGGRRGTCRGIDREGRLLIESADGEVAALTTGHVLDFA